ncbi:MAG TPA: iron-containing alcohol dehydrogenase [Candidatus Eubacterium avistercoris]|uniref:Iron-containing alcohol dehydrogenase n=1 Tax=Candidatus Eubacterium avistercoris TaxID=2838567 RepID=A0A9D2IFA9_9FIRM|nr:iron-containing alcohol dehydrogenase [Candidatus Eubacterium avistercoris]
MKDFEFYTPTKVIFGREKENQVGEIIKSYGFQKVLVHFGGQSAKKSGLLDRVLKSLDEAGIAHAQLGGVQANPTLEMVRKGIALCLEEKVDFVLAVGGGSVIDSSKDIANGAASPEVDVWDFSMKKQTVAKSLPVGVILTLAAAGSEMSSSCVITDEKTGMKRGYNSEYNRPLFAIENPELTYTVDAYQTGCGAVDIMMHTMERYLTADEGTYLTDGIAEGVMRAAAQAGLDCIRDPENYEARANMMWASSVAHNDLTQCGRTFFMQVHQLEHEISGMYPQVAHGAGLAALWGSWARYVYKEKTERFAQFANRVWNIPYDFENPERTALAGIEAQENYYRSIRMPVNLKSLGVKEEDLEQLAENCSFGRTRMLPGIRELDCGDMLEIYKMAYEA